MPIQISNVRCGIRARPRKGDRIGFKFVGEGATRKKVRFFKSNSEVVDWLRESSWLRIYRRTTSEKVTPALQKKLALQCDGGAAHHQDHAQHGRGRGDRSTRRSSSTPCNDMIAIAGQKPVVTKTKIAISAFKVRENYPVGVKVTLRRERMWEFLERLISIALPRIRDFRGISARGFDGRGNFNFGITEQIIFPEIDFDKVDAVRGMNITITTTAKNDERGPSAPRRVQLPVPKEAKSWPSAT